MTVEGNIGRIRALLDKISQYERLILSDNFEPSTIADLKDNAKDFCDAAKSEIDTIKSEIDNWG